MWDARWQLLLFVSLLYQTRTHLQLCTVLSPGEDTNFFFFFNVSFVYLHARTRACATRVCGGNIPACLHGSNIWCWWLPAPLTPQLGEGSWGWSNLLSPRLAEILTVLETWICFRLSKLVKTCKSQLIVWVCIKKASLLGSRRFYRWMLLYFESSSNGVLIQHNSQDPVVWYWRLGMCTVPFFLPPCYCLRWEFSWHEKLQGVSCFWS